MNTKPYQELPIENNVNLKKIFLAILKNKNNFIFCSLIGLIIGSSLTIFSKKEFTGNLTIFYDSSSKNDPKSIKTIREYLIKYYFRNKQNKKTFSNWVKDFKVINELNINGSIIVKHKGPNKEDIINTLFTIKNSLGKDILYSKSTNELIKPIEYTTLEIKNINRIQKKLKSIYKIKDPYQFKKAFLKDKDLKKDKNYIFSNNQFLDKRSKNINIIKLSLNIDKLEDINFINNLQIADVKNFKNKVFILNEEMSTKFNQKNLSLYKSVDNFKKSYENYLKDELLRTEKDKLKIYKKRLEIKSLELEHKKKYAKEISLRFNPNLLNEINKEIYKPRFNNISEPIIESINFEPRKQTLIALGLLIGTFTGLIISLLKYRKNY